MKMAWLGKEDSAKILHLNINGRWLPYNSPQASKYSVPDYDFPPNGSKGWRTFQTLLKAGWTVCNSAEISGFN